jgi:ABC-type multidrug transport system ATPase subunit
MLLPLIRQGTTVFLTTHLLDEAEYADRVGMIESGVLRALASPSELRQLLATAPSIAAEVASVGAARAHNDAGMTSSVMVEPVVTSGASAARNDANRS